MIARRGFTLLEVIVALVIMGLVVSLAYASAQAGFDTERRLEHHRSAGEAEVTTRALLVDALRHTIPGVRGGPPVFELVRGAGVSGDSVVFLTRGIIPPLGTSATWKVTVAAGPHGLRLQALPQDTRTDAASRSHDTAGTLSAELPDVASLDVRVLGRGSSAAWSEEWTDAGVAPQAVRLTFLSPAGAAIGAPIVVRLGLERVP